MLSTYSSVIWLVIGGNVGDLRSVKLQGPASQHHKEHAQDIRAAHGKSLDEVPLGAVHGSVVFIACDLSH